MDRRRKIPPEKMIEAVKRYLNNEGSKSEIARQYGITRQQFSASLEMYIAQGVKGIIKNKRNIVYAEETKV